MLESVTGCLSADAGVDGISPAVISREGRRCLVVGQSVDVLLLAGVLGWMRLLLMRIPLMGLQPFRMGWRRSRMATRTCRMGNWEGEGIRESL